LSRAEDDSKDPCRAKEEKPSPREGQMGKNIKNGSKFFPVGLRSERPTRKKMLGEAFRATGDERKKGIRIVPVI